MRCAGCKRELEVGDQYIQFTQTEWAERNALPQLGEEFDDIFGQLMGSGLGDKIIYCEDCTEKTDGGWLFDTVYGDEDDA